MPRRSVWIASVLLCVVFTGCERWQGWQSGAESDSTGVVLDSVRVVLDSARVDTGRVVVDTSRVDSMADQLARMEAQVQRLMAGQVQTNAMLDSVLTVVDTTRAASEDSTSVLDRRARLQEGIRSFGLNVVLALLVFGIVYGIIRGTSRLLETLAERTARRRLFFKKLIPIFRITAWSITIYFILVVIFQLTEDRLLAASAAVGVAVGFASQDILKNVIGGVLIILDQPFQTGDKINVGGTYGEVISVGLRSTRIVTPDDNLVTVPNAQVVEGQVSNANAGALDCQVVTPLFVPGWIDVMEAKQIAYQAAANSKYVYLKKPVVVLVQDMFEDMFLTKLLVKAYVIDTRYESVFASDVTEAAKAEFQQRGWIPAVTTMHRLAPNDTMPQVTVQPEEGGQA